MSSEKNFSISPSDFDSNAPLRSDRHTLQALVRAGAMGGIIGAMCIWIYEALVW